MSRQTETFDPHRTPEEAAPASVSHWTERLVGRIVKRHHGTVGNLVGAIGKVLFTVCEEAIMVRGSKVFKPVDVSESNASSLPEPFREGQRKRYNRRLGDHAGLKNYGVNLIRVLPGGQSSFRHAHSRQDEFVYVIEGEFVLVTDAGRETVGPGTCIGFPAGTGEAHHFLNLTQNDAVFLVIGDRPAGDEVTYSDIDLELKAGADGVRGFYRKDGTPYPPAARD
jgi:uncharacterized cupin superfamily protein